MEYALEEEDEEDEVESEMDDDPDGSLEDLYGMSSESDSVFGSDLDGGDDDLGVLRKKAGRRGSAAM